MSGRHSGLRYVRAVLPCLFAALAFTAGACATSANNTEHGPSFGEDAGDSAASDEVTGCCDDTGVPESSADTAAPGDSSMSADTSTPTDGPIVDSGTTANDSGMLTGGDSGGCASTMALLATGTSGLAEALYSGGAWATAITVPTGGPAPPARPSLVPFSGGYLGAFVTGASQLDWTAYAASWDTPAQLGSTPAQGTPALAVNGSGAEVVYWGTGPQGAYYSGTYASGAWTAGTDVTPQGGAQSFGSSGPAAAAVGSSVVAVQAGTNGVLYDQTWTAGTWQAASAHTGTSLVPTVTPAVVALQGGTADLMIVYVRAGDANDYHLDYTTRTGGTWSAPVEIYDVSGTIAFTGFTPSLAALPGGGALVVFQGLDNTPYASTYTAGSGWTQPAQITTSTLVSPAVVAQGVCGAIAIAAFVPTGGAVQVATLTGTTWSSPVAITGATGVQSVAIATSP
jgi:hypothetical protein